jgi:hypothetical protein
VQPGSIDYYEYTAAMQHLATAVAQPSDVETRIFLLQASSPANGEWSWLAAPGPPASSGGRAVDSANRSRFC